ncbi:MAG TPA: hybrid sensor histidine kinase/response regulator [Polyangiaceae bacterium]|nr:hybrid sensor histidine kinase/response regulator [Polyangiaceae bacterium]
MTSAERERRVDASNAVLVLVRGPRDGELTAELLKQARVACHLCVDVAELCSRIEAGEGAAVLVAEEMLTPPALERLSNILSHQPPWSDFPLLVFGASARSQSERSEGLIGLGNVTFLDRPVRVRSMIASVRAAVRARDRQYEARRAIESRDSFLAMLGHELRNPLGAIAFALSVLGKKGVVQGLKEHAVIERQSRHLSRLVDDLLDVARVTHGKVDLKLEKLNLVEVARGAFEALEGRAREQHFSYEFVSDTSTIFVDGDRQRLEQVFANLLTNAIKYTRRGGGIKMRLSCEDEGDLATVAVIDNGVGLAPDMRERVFEPFTQVDESLDRAQGGLGLGLALVRSIVQLHGGSVEAESAGLGHGSTFVVRLHRRADDLPSAPRASPDAVAVTPRKVLVVDDNEDIRELFVVLLRQAGHEVAYAEDGPHGFAEVLRFKPEIAFVDLGLPGFDGLELARRVRAAGARVYLIALTGYGQREDKQRTAEAGFDDHLVKPALDADVERAIRRANATLSET